MLPSQLTECSMDVRTVKLVWIEDNSFYFRWFFSLAQAENWAWSQLIDKNVCNAGQIEIHQTKKK